MPMAMMREAWTDERLDDLKEHMDERFGEVVAEQQALRADLNGLRGEVGDVRSEVGTVRSEIGEVRREVGEVRSEVGEVRSEVGKVREGLGEVKAEIKGLNRTLQIGFGLIGSFLGVLGILIAAQL